MAPYEILTVLVSLIISIISIENIFVLMRKLVHKSTNLSAQRGSTIININITDDSGNVIETKKVPLEEAQHVIRVLKKVPETPPISTEKN